MKKLIVGVASAALLIACGSGNSNSSASKAPDGRELFRKHCVSCHQASGEGIPKVFPPLKDSDYLLEDPTRAIHNIIKGMQGKVVVNGIEYNGVMVPVRLDDAEIVAVVNYVLKDLNQTDQRITLDQVKKVRSGS